MTDLENLAVQNGFDSTEELFRLVSSIDLSTDENLRTFTSWKTEDGTKEGLLKLFPTKPICIE